MNAKKKSLDELTSLFWQSIPPMWHQTKSVMHQHATREYNITIGQYHILRRIRNGQNSVSLLADSGYITRAAASRQVNTLAEKGLLTRSTNPQDRRNIQLILTDQGEKLFTEIFEIGHCFLAEHFDHLSSDQLENVIEAMRLFQAAFPQKSNPSKH